MWYGLSKSGIMWVDEPNMQIFQHRATLQQGNNGGSRIVSAAWVIRSFDLQPFQSEHLDQVPVP